MSDESPLASYQDTFGDSASSDEVDAYEDQFGETHPVFRVPHRPERHTLGGSQ